MREVKNLKNTFTIFEESRAILSLSERQNALPSVIHSHLNNYINKSKLDEKK